MRTVDRYYVTNSGITKRQRAYLVAAKEANNGKPWVTTEEVAVHLKVPTTAAYYGMRKLLDGGYLEKHVGGGYVITEKGRGVLDEQG